MELWIYRVTTILILFATLFQECNAKTHFKYMKNYCSETVEVTTSLVVVLAPTEILQSQRRPDYFHCSVDLMADKGRRLHVHFLHLSISSDEKHTDRLKLYDIVPGRSRIPITPAQGVYGMLDKSLRISDKLGSNVGEFTSRGRVMQVEYLGKPTQNHSGFRILITTVADKEPSGKCPHSTFDCPNQQWCVPSILLCDGYPNCGERDPKDEDGCNLNNLVSSVSYSLTEDILLIVMLPLVLFVLAIIIVVLTTRWHVNRKYPPLVPSVKYINDGDGEVDLEGRTTRQPGEEPPSYSEAVAHAPQTKRYTTKPPSYNKLRELEHHGDNQYIRDEKDHQNNHKYHHRHPHQQCSPLSRSNRVQERWSRDIMTTSNSSIENIDDQQSCSSNSSRPASRQHIHQQRQRRISPRPLHDLDFSFSEDEETKRKARKKGGKSKSKRRADDLCSPETFGPVCNSTIPVSKANNPCFAQNQQEPYKSTPCSTSLPHSTSSSLINSPLTSPSSANSVPFSSTSSTENKNIITPSLSSVSSFSQIALRNNSHPSNAHRDPLDSNSGRNAAVLPLSSSTCVAVHNGSVGVNTESERKHHLYKHETVLHSSDLSMSSGTEADKNNISETESVVYSFVDENNGKTESCASSNNSHDGLDCIIEDPKDKKNAQCDKNKRRNENVDLNRNVKKNGKVSKRREIKKKNNNGGKVIFGLSPFDSKVNSVESDDDDEISARKDLCEDADVSSDSDNGVEVDLRIKEVISLQDRKKLQHINV